MASYQFPSPSSWLKRAADVTDIRSAGWGSDECANALCGETGSTQHVETGHRDVQMNEKKREKEGEQREGGVGGGGVQCVCHNKLLSMTKQDWLASSTAPDTRMS